MKRIKPFNVEKESKKLDKKVNPIRELTLILIAVVLSLVLVYTRQSHAIFQVNSSFNFINKPVDNTYKKCSANNITQSYRE